MNPSLRRNACPSLTAPMQTGDGLLVRINTVTGAISPTHLGLVAEAAARHGNGILEVTRRGSLQVRGLTTESSGPFSREVLESAIDVRTGVPVETGPLAGLDLTEIADPRKIAAQLIDKIDKTDLARRLCPKVSVVVDGGGQLSMRDVLADVRLTAVENDRGVRWQVSVGGTAETARVVGIANKGVAAELALELLGAIARRGRTGRGKDLTDADISKTCEGKIDQDRHRSHATLPPSVLPDISPARGEIGSCDRAASSATSTVGEGRAEGAISPLVGEMSGRTEGGNVEREHARSISMGLPIGPFPVKHDRTALGFGLPFGQASADQLSALVQVAEHAQISELRLAPGGALLAICETRAATEEFGRIAARLGFIVDPQDPRLKIVACAGAPACSSGLIQTKEIAAEIATAGVLPESGVVHVSGCAKGCAEPFSPAYTILGTPDGASILEGKGDGDLARGGGSELGRVDCRELARVAEREVAAAFQRVVETRDMGRDTKSAPPVPHRKSA